MTYRRERLIARLRELQRVDGITSSDVELFAHEMAPTATAFTLDTSPARHPKLPELQPARVLDAWRRYEKDEPLTADDLFHLESIVVLGGARPAFDITNDSFPDLPAPRWQAINDQKSALEPLIRGIGRLDLIGHPNRSYAGTAFVCGERRLLTNRHVAQLFVEGVGSQAQLQFTPGILGRLDLKQEVGSTLSLVTSVVAPVLVHDQWDLAVLEVDQLPPGVAPLPLLPSSLSDPSDGIAAIIGYPALDPEENLLEQLQIFRSTFEKKRLQPGRLKGMLAASSFGRIVQALGHDCSTLGGNSGSALIDIESATVVGIHFTGQPMVANYAVPTWVLANDPRVVASGVEF